MKRTRTYIALLLAFALCCGLLSGCDGLTPSVPAPATDTPAVQDTAPSGTVSEISPSSGATAPVSAAPSDAEPSPDASPDASPKPSPSENPPSPVPSPSATVTITDPTSPLAPSSIAPSPARSPSPSPSQSSSPPKPQATPYPVQTLPVFTSELISSSSGTSEVEIGCRNDGYVKVHYTGDRKIVVQIIYETNKGTFNNFVGTGEGWYAVPLTFGNGSYAVRVMENTVDSSYRQIQKVDANVTLTSQHAPYLAPSYQVNYTSDSQTAKKARELVAGTDGDLARAEAIFKYIVQNYVYDNGKANDVRAGKITSDYKPDIDAILNAKKGICYDYAALYAAMLRSVGIPARMIIGKIPEGRHAWNEVYISGTGWIKVNGEFYFDGKKYTRMDSTWAAANSTGKYNEYFKDDSKYTTEEVY